MANKIRIKRRASNGAATAPSTSQCVNAELAFNEASGTLFYGKGGDETASSAVVGIAGEKYSLIDGVTAGTAAAGKALTLDSNRKLSLISGGNPGQIDIVDGGININTNIADSYYFSLTNTNAGGAKIILGVGETSGGIGTATWTIRSEDGLEEGDFSLLWPSQTGRIATISDINAAIAEVVGITSALKTPVVAATTTNITLSGTQTIDGIAVASGDRVLVKNQSTGSQNGIYVVASGSWSRATDVDTGAELLGASVFVLSGATNGNKTFINTNTGTITLGTTAVTFADQTTATTITAGDGLTKTGNTINVVSTGAGSLNVTADSINLASGIIASTGTYRSVQVDTYGRVTAGTNPTTFSGYSLSDTSANLASALTDETGWATGAKAVFSTSPSFETSVVTSTTGTFSVFNTNATTVNAFGAATTLNLGYDGNGTSTTNIATGGLDAPYTKTINIGTGGYIGGDQEDTGDTTVNIGTGDFTDPRGSVNVHSVLNVAAGLSVWAAVGNGHHELLFDGGGLRIVANAADYFSVDTATLTTQTKNLVVSGDLTVNGTATILNTNTLSVDDKNVTLGDVATTSSSPATVTAGSAVITVPTTSGVIPGMAVSALADFGTVTVPANTRVATVNSATQITLTQTLTGSGSSTSATVQFGGATDFTADGGGITLKGATDKTFNWVSSTGAWTSSEHLALATGKTLILYGATSGSVTLSVPAAAGTTAISFPATAGTVVTTGDTGTVSATMLASAAVETAKIKDANVTAAKLASDAVETAKIKDANVTAAKLASDAVETAKIKDANVTAAKLAANSVETAKIADNAVSFAKLPNSAAAGLSVVGRSADSAGNFAEINAGTDGHVLRRSGTTLGFGTIATAGIADGAVTNAKIADSTLTRDKFAAGELCAAVDSCTIDGGTF